MEGLLLWLLLKLPETWRSLVAANVMQLYKQRQRQKAKHTQSIQTNFIAISSLTSDWLWTYYNTYFIEIIYTPYL